MITREDQIEQSVQDFVRAGLVAANYTDSVVKVRDAFPTIEERATELSTTQVSVGFNFDDGGKNIELGSDLKMRLYTLEFWVFGTSLSKGRNIANVIRVILEDSGLVPLKDIGTTGHPVIDQLVIRDDRGVMVTRQINPSPHPWDQFVFTTVVKLEDTYYPALVN